jgi:hypothetical protein
MNNQCCCAPSVRLGWGIRKGFRWPVKDVTLRDVPLPRAGAPPQQWCPDSLTIICLTLPADSLAAHTVSGIVACASSDQVGSLARLPPKVLDRLCSCTSAILIQLKTLQPCPAKIDQPAAVQTERAPRCCSHFKLRTTSPAMQRRLMVSGVDEHRAMGTSLAGNSCRPERLDP